mmetsp:Transcript_33306/g.72673  ORF Transcript_33306/g.72673 Transcript_33306/m.72673 type:complete len:281 (+) Transcript_33306:126-968(+)|eukprot:CAMPEP_0118949362 /NCGR_PEP_ID=MMETSP1169-20130426/49480_1 /TAXON_ID=36882 /ORGANISM="Pyramimonas obovata, Strain CCMP722" /LENGTH=280 /DNA_ID=CAMNT_0006895977 /DNA_START=52 /DNA_END=894 /DNA_ORIENTATION=+
MSGDWREDCERRRETYADLREQQQGAGGLDEKAIASAIDCYERPPDGKFVPVTYASKGIPDNSVRYIAVALDGKEGGRELRDCAAEVTAELIQSQGLEAYINPKDTLHITIFHTGRPEKPEWHRPLNAVETAQEKATMTELVASTGFSKGTFKVVVDDVVLASSGVLLLLMSAPDGMPTPVDELRAKCRATFTNATFKQATYVLHTSLARLVSVESVNNDQLREAVKSASAKLKGMTATLRTVWYVEETSMMSCHAFGGSVTDIANKYLSVTSICLTGSE